MQIANLVVVGVGLIGGSCALALRAAGAVSRVIGVGRGRANLDDAVSRGIIDVAYALGDDWTKTLADADVVLVAAPVAQYPMLFGAIAPAIGEATVVTDAGSTKQGVISAARATFGARFPHFVAGHPIAGTERSGAAAAHAALFDGRPVVLTPVAETAEHATATIAALWRACGAHVAEMKPDEHDRVYAAVSHLPHMLAFALVAEFAARPDGATLLRHAGSGFRDFTRIAASSPENWRDIALANRDALQDELRRYRNAVGELERLLAEGDGPQLAALFERAARTRREWGATPTNIDDDGAAC